MTRFSGRIGFAQTVRTSPGVSEEKIVEKGPYKGKIERRSRTLLNNDSINGDTTMSTTISVVASDEDRDNYLAIRFVVSAGVPWEVAEATIERPRILMRLGGVYNGERAEPAPSEVPDAP
jgi:hypothetical protein